MPLATFSPLLLADLVDWMQSAGGLFLVILGFSIIIFFHELGHFIAAKWVGVRVHRFAVGFGPRLFGFRPGEGFTFGSRPDYSTDELDSKRFGETDYCMNLLPIGGYVKMLGHDDILVNEETGDIKLTTDPRAFNNRPVGQRALVVSAGVVFNLLLAALLIIIVFMVGWRKSPPIIGAVYPSSTAFGKLQPGDRVLAIDESPCDTFDDIMYSGFFAREGAPLKFEIERGGEKRLTEEVFPEFSPRLGIGYIDVSPASTNIRGLPGRRVGSAENVEKDDRIIAVEGAPVSDGIAIGDIFKRSGGKVLTVRVQRPDSSSPAGHRELDCPQRASLVFDPVELTRDASGRNVSDHLLGFERRRRVSYIAPDSPAERAGFKIDDVIVDWAGRANPTFTEIVDANRANVGKAISANVLRGEESRPLEVTPKSEFTVVGEAPPAKVGIGFERGEEDHPIVANIVADTPAATLGMPRGSLILAIDGREIKDWFQVCDALMAAAGREVAVRFRSGGDEVEKPMRVPSSLVNELNLPNTVTIVAVNGQTEITKSLGGQERQIPLYRYGAAVREVLKEHIGSTVKLTIRRTNDAKTEEIEFAVREDNTDPWQLRIRYDYDSDSFIPLTSLIQSSNPIVAGAMGVREVKRMVAGIYLSLAAVATRKASVDTVSGPVGIVRMGVQTARLGIAELLVFLALISVNLAVINFLPIPVMDGGLMVFLLIEKIKGKPLSLKTQMYTTLVGLAAIILVGIFVTIQDVGRWLF